MIYTFARDRAIPSEIAPGRKSAQTSMHHTSPLRKAAKLLLGKTGRARCLSVPRSRIYVNIQIDERKGPLSAASGQTGFIAFRPSSRNRPCPNRRTLLNSRRRFCCKSKTPQTLVRVLGRSVEQPPEYWKR